MESTIHSVLPEQSASYHDIQWEDHFCTLVNVLRNFTANGILTDITFVSGKEKIAVHRVILSCFTSYFNQFMDNESIKYFILMEEFDGSILQGIVDYIYTGTVCIPRNDVIKFYRTAELLKMEGFLQFESSNDNDMSNFTWPKHREMIIQCLWESRQKPCQCDVMFVTNNHFKTFTHSSVLGACSTFLLDIFQKHENKRKPYVFVLQNVSTKTLELVLEYCYKGSVQVINEDMNSVYSTADLLGIQSLCKKLSSAFPTLDETTQRQKIQQIPEYINIVRTSQLQPERSLQAQNILSNLLEFENLVDIFIFVDKHMFKAHSVILIAFSIYFRNLAKYLEHCIKDIFILVKDFRIHHMQAFLDYIYKGEAKFGGSAENFSESMLDWLDFDLLPVSMEYIPCKTSTPDVKMPQEEEKFKEWSQAGKDLRKLGNIPDSTPDSRIKDSDSHNQDHKQLSLENDLCRQNTEDNWEDGSTVANILLQEEEDIKVDEEEVDMKEHADEDEENDISVKAEEQDTEAETSSKKAKRKWIITGHICHTCNEKFETRQQFREHLAIHPDAKIIKCKYCGKGFDKPSQMKLHLRIHTGARPFQCTLCGMSFAAKSALTKHKDTHAKEKAKVFVCDVCNKSFSRKEYLEEHIRTHTGSKPYSCNMCQKTFVGRTGLNHHKKTHAAADEKKSAVCEICGKSFTRHALWTHMKSHNKAHKCELCHKFFATTTALKIHVAGTHLGHRRHQCEICGKGFMQKNHLIRHMKVHQNENDEERFDAFACDKCPRTFKTESKLESHMRNEHSEPGYSCNICHKRFAGRSTVIYHRRAHTGERPHSCSTCGKSFVRPDALRQHIRSHTGERLFECSVCTKKCATRSALNKHVLSHKTDNDPGSANFTCSICSKTFNSKSQLSIHARVHTGSRPFRCDICRKSFRYQDSLTKHLRVHSAGIVLQSATTNELPCIYSFQVCRQTFDQVDDLNTHIKPAETSTYVGENIVHREDIAPESMHQYNIPASVVSDNVCVTSEEKNPIGISLLPRRPYSITMDGNLCCNDEGVLPPDGNLVPTLALVPPPVAPHQELDSQELHSTIATSSSSHLLHQHPPSTHIELNPVAVPLSPTANVTYPSILSKAFSL